MRSLDNFREQIRLLGEGVEGNAEHTFARGAKKTNSLEFSAWRSNVYRLSRSACEKRLAIRAFTADKDRALEKIEDLTLLSDIFPTGYDGAVKAGVTTGSTVYVAGAGPVGLACAAACQLLGAAVVIVGDMIPERLAQARSFGCETTDLRERITLGEPSHKSSAFRKSIRRLIALALRPKVKPSRPALSNPLPS